MNILQIGANKGFDDLTDIIRDKDVKTFIIVEPISFHNDSIQKCYQHIKNIYIENVAISEKTADFVDFYYHTKDGPGYEVASLDIEHIIKHGYSKEGIEKISVPCTTVNALLDKFGIKNLDILYLDAEGTDEEIIRSIDFSKVNIDKIYYENLHLKTDLTDFLSNLDYNLVQKFGLNGWTSLAYR